MPKKNIPLPVVLPARMSLNADALKGFDIAVLQMPYQEEINTFLQRLRHILRKSRLDWWQYPQYRLLNNAIMACAPTLVHGFEKFGMRAPRQMLAVGKPTFSADGNVIGTTLCYPSENQLAQLMRLWLQHWPSQQRWLNDCIKGEGKEAWNDFQRALQVSPQTHWRIIDATTLATNLSAENGLSYRAIPSLLATLLGGTTSIISQQERLVRWRKMQEGANRLCIVSNPLPISFIRKSRFVDKAESGFFTYKLEFHLQTQAGREEPWIHVFLRCQRYAEETLTRNRRGNDITIFVGMNQERLAGWEYDSTLVRLKAKPYPAEKYAGWTDNLSELLADFNARPLEAPFQLYQNPRNFWNQSEQPSKNDEYYVLHTEGYKYGYRSHPVMTGFGLAERSEIIAQTCCETLGEILQPDTSFEPDPILFENSSPLALWTFRNLAQTPPLMSKDKAGKQGLSDEQRQRLRQKEKKKQRQERQTIIVKAIECALRGKQFAILLIYREQDTYDALLGQLREAFLLNEGDRFPDNVLIIPKRITDPTLCSPLTSGDLDSGMRNRHPSLWTDNFGEEWDRQIRRARQQKLQAWDALWSDISFDNNTYYAALIELPKEPESTREFHTSQGIKGIVREACARKRITSQMLHPVRWATNKETQQRYLSDAEKGRVANVVQEITTRHIGSLYDQPSTVYAGIGIPEPVFQTLDVIAFCLRPTQTGVRYGCAVRLRASGEVDVLLPRDKGEWRTYAGAGPSIGYQFAEARKELRNGKIPDKGSSHVRFSSDKLSSFVEETISQHLERPTIVIIEADNWRRYNYGGWVQLQNPILSTKMDVLEFGQYSSLRSYSRDNDDLSNLLAVIRLRQGDETPQYITNRESWQRDESRLTRDIFQLSGFVDKTTTQVFHYFSIGRLQDTIKGPQTRKRTEDPYKLEDGGGVAFKHQQMVELVPFFVRTDFNNEQGLRHLCRVPHYLRYSPAWSTGNTILPYPMHLGNQLIEDQLCILGNEG